MTKEEIRNIVERHLCRSRVREVTNCKSCLRFDDCAKAGRCTSPLALYLAHLEMDLFPQVRQRFKVPRKNKLHLGLSFGYETTDEILHEEAQSKYACVSVWLFGRPRKYIYLYGDETDAEIVTEILKKAYEIYYERTKQ